MALGIVVLAQLGVGSSYWVLLAGILPLGAGMALATAPATTDIVAALPAHKQGVASAVNDAAREVGGTLGIAVLGSVLNGVYRADVSSGLPGADPEVAHQAQDSLPAALAIAGRLGEPGDAVAAVARDAFAHGMTVAYVASGAVLVLVAAVLAVAHRGSATAVASDEDVAAAVPELVGVAS